jgi:hypothetical protein
MLLEDIQLNKIQILEEATSTKPMKIKGVFQRAEEPNKNKRIYPRTVLEASIEALKPIMESRQLLGELDHPAEGVVKLQNASHLITNLSWKGNDMIGEAEILNTPAGKIAQALIRDGVQVGISSRGQGSLSEANSEGYAKVNEDYRMITFDLVADPSTKGAFPSLAESFIRKSILPVIGEERLVKAIRKAAKYDNKPAIIDEDSKLVLDPKTNMDTINEHYGLQESSLGSARTERLRKSKRAPKKDRNDQQSRNFYRDQHKQDSRFRNDPQDSMSDLNYSSDERRGALKASKRGSVRPGLKRAARASLARSKELRKYNSKHRHGSIDYNRKKAMSENVTILRPFKLTK